MSGIQIVGNTNNTTAAEVEANTLALRATIRPIDYTSFGIYSLAGTSGTMAAALAANSPVFSFRYTGSNLALVKRVLISAGDTSTAFTAGIVTFSLFAARSFSASDTGGTTLTPSGNANKLKTSMATTGIGDARISSTATLTAGTRTLDGQPLGAVSSAIVATAGSLLLPYPYPLLDQRVGEYPYTCANNEGFVIEATVPATGTWTFSVQAYWEEVASGNWY